VKADEYHCEHGVAREASCNDCHWGLNARQGISAPQHSADLDAMRQKPVAEKIAPVQGYTAGIPWSLHLEAYDAYCKRWSPQKALIEGGCRGGFHVDELDQFIPGWRDRVSEIGRLKARVAELERAAIDAALQAKGVA
jgi:hypothetical protein